MDIKRKGKKWVARVWTVTSTGYRSRPQKQFDSKQEAERWIVQITGRKRTHTEQRTPRTFEEVVAHYKGQDRYKVLADKSQSTYESRIDRFALYLKSLGIKYIHQFEDEDAKHYYELLLTEGSVGSADSKLTCAQMLIREEMKRRDTLVVRNPFVVVQRRKKPESEIRYFDPKEIEILKAEMDQYQWHILMLLLNTGMRTGELANLTWDQIRFSDNRILIRPHDNWVPKWKINRTIPINASAKRCLMFFREATEGMKYVVAGNTRLSHNHINNEYRKVEKRTSSKHRDGNLADTSAKTFRATAGSLMLQRGSRTEEVSKFLGHRDIRTTQKHYASLCHDNLAAAAQLLESF